MYPENGFIEALKSTLVQISCTFQALGWTKACLDNSTLYGPSSALFYWHTVYGVSPCSPFVGVNCHNCRIMCMGGMSRESRKWEREKSLENRRRNARLLLFYKGVHGLSAIPCNLLRRPLRNSRHSDSDTFTVLSSRVDSYNYSFFPRTISEWNKLSQDVRSKPSVASFRSALLKVPGPVEINLWVMALRQ